jgi:predicted metal-dependent hydrolase
MSKVGESTVRRELELADERVRYEVQRSEDATEPRIDVDIYGVRVVLPADAEVDPGDLLRDNAEWVLAKTAKYEQYRAEAPRRSFEPGEAFPYLGEDHEIVVERRSASAVTDESFRLAAHHVDQTSVRRALETLYRRLARAQFEERADHFASEMGVAYEGIELRNQRTRWGSCSTTGTLSLNWRLVMAPEDIVDYVVVHELAHLVEANHSRQFWQLVETQLPDYQRRADWLDENSAQLIFDEGDL